MISFIDLFSGTGGIRIGLENALKKFSIESRCVFSSEINKEACKTYSLNFEKQEPSDIHFLDTENGAKLPFFDILLAGFPCQAFSYAGKRMGFDDTRGTLFFEVARIAKEHKPKILFLENVRGLTTHDGGRTFKTISNTLNELGYKVKWRIINSSEMGIPQNRFRLYGIAVYGVKDFNLTIPDLLGSKDSHSLTDRSFISHKYIKDILEDNPPLKYDCSDTFRRQLENYFDGDLSKIANYRCIDSRNGKSIHSWDLDLKGSTTHTERSLLNQIVANRRKHIFGTQQDGKALSLEQIQSFYNVPNLPNLLENLVKKGYLRVDPGDRYNLSTGNMSFEIFKFLDPDSISITLTSSDCNRLGVYHKGRLRHLTPRECARIQGYPDSYILNPNDSESYKQIGNAVSVPVIQKLLENFLINNPEFIAQFKQ